MIILIKNEFIKLFSRKSSWIMPIIIILITFAYSFMMLNDNKSVEKQEAPVASQSNQPESKGGIIATKTPDGKFVENEVLFYDGGGNTPPKKGKPELVALTVQESIPVLEETLKFFEKESAKDSKNEELKMTVTLKKQELAYYKKYKELGKTPHKNDGEIQTSANFIASLGGTTLLATIFCVIVSSMIVAMEFSGGTVKLLLTRPCSRMQVIWSKYIVAICYGLLINLVMILSTLAFSFLLPYQALTLPLEPSSGGVTGLEMTLQYLGSNSLMLLFYITISLFISAVLRSQAFAVAIGMGFLLSGITLPTLFPKLISQVDFLKWLPFNLLGLNSQVISPTQAAAGALSILETVIALIIYIIIVQTATLLIFNKRDVALA